jgi:hypothetical protein
MSIHKHAFERADTLDSEKKVSNVAKEIVRRKEEVEFQGARRIEYKTEHLRPGASENNLVL